MIFMIAGGYKTGKTVSSGTFPKPMLFFDFDYDGYTSIINTKDKAGTQVVKDIDKITFVHLYREPETFELSMKLDMAKPMAPKYAAAGERTFIELHNHMNSLLKDGTVNLGTLEKPDIKGPFKTIVFDNLTAMFGVWQNTSLKQNNMSSLRLADYGVFDKQFTDVFLPAVRHIPGVDHVVLLDHTTIDRDEITGAISEYPIGTSKAMGKNMGRLFSEIYYQKVEGDKYVWRTRKTGFFQAGSRLNVPDPCDANYDAIARYIK